LHAPEGGPLPCGSSASRPVSRVLSTLQGRVYPAPAAGVTIYLGCMSPCTSCGHTRGFTGGQPVKARISPCLFPPIRPCSRWGLPGQDVTILPVSSYLAVAPLPCAEAHGGLHFCGTFLRVASTGCYPAPCPAEPGLSSGSSRSPRSPGRLAPALF